VHAHRHSSIPCFSYPSLVVKDIEIHANHNYNICGCVHVCA